MTNQPQLDQLIDAWKAYFKTLDDWQTLTKGVTSKPSGCGPIYELPNVLNRPNEGLAIADMRAIAYATPHYHANGETEVYFVLQGEGLMVVGSHETHIEVGSIIIVPSNTAHYVIPDQGSELVIAVINTPPFNPQNMVELNGESMPQVAFDHERFLELTAPK